VSGIVVGSEGGIPVLRLLGELGPEHADGLGSALDAALLSTGGRVLLDLRATLHLHYRVADRLVRLARERPRLGLVGPTPYIRQILRLAGALDGDLTEYQDLGQALQDVAA